MRYTSEKFGRLSPVELLDMLAGNTQYPVTAELLGVVEASYERTPERQAAFREACDAPFADEDRLTWLADYATRSDDRDMWQSAATNVAASLELMATAPAAQFTLHSIQAFIWKHSLATNRLWSDEEVGQLREICATEAAQGPHRWITMRDALKRLGMEPV